MSSTEFSYLKQKQAQKIDLDLFNEYGFSVDQLTEMAGYSCAVVMEKVYPLRKQAFRGKVLVVCGPGYNGGDGLVCARHLALFGYQPEIYYPKRTDKPLFHRLVSQCIESGLPFLDELCTDDGYDFIVDALFGTNFKPPVKKEFVPVINMMKKAEVPIVSIDIPSGWNVNTGAIDGIKPDTLISLFLPKACAKRFTGNYHYLGGRFLPRALLDKHNLKLPWYHGTSPAVAINIK